MLTHNYRILEIPLTPPSINIRKTEMDSKLNKMKILATQVCTIILEDKMGKHCYNKLVTYIVPVQQIKFLHIIMRYA